MTRTQPSAATNRSGALEPRLSDDDLHLFNEGTHDRVYRKLGAHPVHHAGRAGVTFRVWAPNARSVSVIGDFNDWNTTAHPMEPVQSSGIWEIFIPDADQGHRYKYHIVSRFDGYVVDKADPYAFMAEIPPAQASVVRSLEYDWSDQQWMSERGRRQAHDAPMSIYEMHLGSWMRPPDDPNRFIGYREIAEPLAEYVAQRGFTHIELMPIMEHPFYGSWGYQKTGYFAATSRFGTPQDFMYFVDVMHRYGIGVILDWAPAHFPSDEHGLCYFDGSHLYEHADPNQRIHPDWGSYVFNYGRNEVRSFLLSSALFWLDKYHIDGLRVDAVASMLYLDYSREDGQWSPNKYGGRENLEAIDLLRHFNEAVYREYPDAQTIAEESTAWPMVSRPTYVGGLGFGYKWDMGWMHDTLEYMKNDPVHRSYHHNQLTFRAIYAFTENYILPLSHDEVVHGKGSLLGRMVGDEWQRFANLRLLLATQWAQPGKKLLFMGGELAQPWEWSHDNPLAWDLLENPLHRGVQKLIDDLNRIMRNEPALHELDCDPAGFQWVDGGDVQNSVISYIRPARSNDDLLLIVANYTPVVHHAYHIGVPRAGHWQELFNSDAEIYGGSGQGNMGGLTAVNKPSHGYPYALPLTTPPLGLAIFKHNGAQT